MFRRMPHWQVWLFYYGLGVAVAWQFIEDLLIGQSLVHSGAMAPWRQYVDYNPVLGLNHYWWFAATEFVLLVAYFFRIKIRFVALGLGLVMFTDNLGSFLNHRLLMAMQMMLISLHPPERVAKSQLGELHAYWNFDVMRFHVSLIYVVTAIHKCNEQFVSGQTLNNLFYMVHTEGMMRYPDWLFPLIQDSRVCLTMALVSLALEFALAFGLHSRKYGNLLVIIGFATHFAFAVLMPYIWIFTFQMLITLLMFWRTPTENQS